MNNSEKILLEDLENFLFLESREYLRPEQIEHLISLFSEEVCRYAISRTTITNLRRIISSLINKYSFFKDVIKYNHHIEVIVAISLNSNYMTDIVVKSPEFLYQLFDQEYLQKEFEINSLSLEIKKNLLLFKSFDAKVHYLRFLKRRYTLKIGVYDILGFGQFKKVAHQISILAQSIGSQLFSVCFAHVCQRHKIDKIEAKYAAISLGKLAGDELNYSSDIDLMFIYSSNYSINEIRQQDFHELFSEAIQLFASTSNDVVDGGFIYRVDLRLRPDGGHSPLSRSLNDTIFYYETRGEAWEKQMLIKSNYFCGDHELFAEFSSRIAPFVYPKSLFTSPKKRIAEMRWSIERSVTSRVDIKKSAGGIRDIEFLVQMLQLINGGRLKEIRTPNTLEAIARLKNHLFLEQKEANLLEENYVFFRKVEHFLQLMNNIQTHLLPADEEANKHLASFMGLENSSQFDMAIEKRMTETRNLFNRYFEDDENEPPDPIPAINFNNLQRAEKNIKYLRTGTGLISNKEFGNRTIELFKKIEYSIFSYLSTSKNPDLVLENMHSIIKNSGFPSVWYRELQKKELLLDVLVLCEFSARFVNLIVNKPYLAELIFDGVIYQKDLSDQYYDMSLKKIHFILSIQLALKMISQRKFSIILANFLKVKIKKKSDELFECDEYFIAALGSFGCEEMVFSSDIDIVIIVNEFSDFQKTQLSGQAFINELNDRLAPFKVDLKLRPEGKNSSLISDIANYKRYLNDRAELWEFQSLAKLKFICGSQILFDEFAELVISKYRIKSIERIVIKMRDMYSRIIKEKSSSLAKSFDIKYTHGALLTVEFLIDLLIMKNPEYYRSFLGLSYHDKLEHFSGKNTEGTLIRQLSENYSRLKQIEIDFQNILNLNRSILPIANEQTDLLNSYLHKGSDSNINSELSKLIKSNSDIFDKLWN
ncbi:MAG: nucleotidyltransferase domain-containing protein [Bacteroidetes bacterium]|nr:nucleotidyltransferase domain-containing protein [Bacteroidota bacterium]